MNNLNEEIGKRLLSEDFSLSLERVFMCNPANGCTMIWDKELQKELLKIPYDTFTMHDEFLCIIALLLGTVIYDPNPSMYYRLHSLNVTQSNSIIKKFKIWKQIWFGRKPYSIDKRAKVLMTYPSENGRNTVLQEIGDYKKGLNRIKIMKKYKCEDVAIDRSFKIRVLLGLA